MWSVPPEYLCDDHLLGEHKEMHQEGGTLLNHPHGEAVVMGHAKLGQVDTELLERRHEALVMEMERRGMDHSSPWEYDIDDSLGFTDPYANFAELYNRCDDCAARIDEHGGQPLNEYVDTQSSNYL